jgi:hypothetical protein
MVGECRIFVSLDTYPHIWIWQVKEDTYGFHLVYHGDRELESHIDV